MAGLATFYNLKAGFGFRTREGEVFALYLYLEWSRRPFVKLNLKKVVTKSETGLLNALINTINLLC